MATSQYSILRQYTPYVSPYNLDLIKDVMVYKQGQVDANRERINQQVDYLMGQQIAKPEAREYMENRMADTLARINEMYRGADLSSSGIVRHIQGEISSVLDSTVINAVAGTKEGMRMQERLNEMALNGDDAYSDMNAYVAMKPYYEWLSDGKAGSRLQPLHYTPYTDYNAEMASIMENIQKAALKGRKYSFPLIGDDGQPTGAMIEYNSSSITPQQVAAVAASSISPNARRQMQIEAVYMSDMNPDQFSYESYQGYVGSQIANMEDYIGSLNAEMMGVGGNDHRKQELQSEINRAKADLVRLKQLSEVPAEAYSPYQAASVVVERNFLNSAAQRYSFDNSSTEIKEDPMYWNKKNYDIKVAGYNLDVAKAEADNKYRQERLNLQREALEIRRMEAENKAAENGPSGSGSSSSGSRSSRVPTSSTVTNPTFSPEEVDAAKENSERYSGMVSQRLSEVNKMFGMMRQEDRDNINKFINEAKKNPNSGYAGLSMEDALIKYIDDHGGLNNTLFSSYSEDDTEDDARRRTSLIDSYNTISKLTQSIRAENARLNELDALSSQYISEAFPGLIEEYGGRSNIDNPTASAMKNLVWDSVYRHSRDYGSSFTPDLISSLNRDINAIQKEYDRLNGVQSEDINIWDYFSLDGNTGTYRLVVDNNSPEAILALAELYNTGNADGQSKLANNVVRRYSDFDASKAQRDVENRYYQQRLRKERIYSTKMNNSDPEYGTMNVLRDLHTRYRDQAPVRNKNSFANVDSYLLRELPDGRFQIVAMYNGVNTSVATVSREDLVSNGVNIGDMGFNIPTGGYNSGQRKVSFADPNNVDYIQIVKDEMGGGGDAYATKSGTEGILSGDIETGFNLRATRFDQDVRDELKRQMGIMIASILDNSEKFRVQMVGFDRTTSQSSGFDTVVSLENPKNPEGKPKMILKSRTDGVEYMDDFDTKISRMPQVVFTETIQQGIKNEIEYLARKGYSMEDIVRLTNERKPIFDPSGILMRLYSAANEGGDANAQ